MSFRLKTVIGIALIEFILLAILIWSSLSFLRSSNEEKLVDRAATTATLFATTTTEAVLTTDLASLESFIREALSNPGLVYARVRDDDMSVLAEDGDRRVLGRMFRADSELDSVDDGVFDTFEDIEIEGMMLGRVEIGLSVDNISAVMSKATSRTLTIAAIAMVLSAIFSLVLGFYLTRQLADLRRASNRLADGDLSYRIPVRGRDELAATALAFNQMSEKLHRSLRQLESARDQAERANAAKSELLSRVSHELRTPMNAILGFAELMVEDEDEPLTEQQKESTDQILQAGWHLLKLIDEVLDIAKIEAGRMQLSIESVIAASVLDEALALIEPMAAERQITVRSKLSAQPVAVLADPVRLKQILLNLLSNAVKYNRDGGLITVEVKVRATTQTGHGGDGDEPGDSRADDRVTISVRDTGHGMSQSELKSVFEPFTRHRNAARIEGTGIGLSITRQLVHLMQGEIGVDSALEVGTRFWITLPAGQVSAASSPERRRQVTTRPSEARTGPLTILYVEDNPANIKLLERVISRSWPQAELLSVHNAELGLDIARARRPQLILMDISLPGMSGYEALAELRGDERTADIPVIALSANATTRDVAKGQKAGFAAYLTKPLQIEHLIEAVTAHLEQKSTDTSAA
ncbi:MAG: ATP-binding protein [Myxococcota bacterium]